MPGLGQGMESPTVSPRSDPPAIIRRTSLEPPPIRRPIDEEMKQRLQEVHDSVIAVHDEDYQRLEEVTKGAGGSRRRALHHQGMLQKLSTAEQGGERCVQAWLFDDLIMYARPLPGSGKFQLLRWVPLLGCQVASTTAGGKRGSAAFTLTVSGKKGMGFLAKDVSDRDTWVSEIRECIAETKVAHEYYLQHPEEGGAGSEPEDEPVGGSDAKMAELEAQHNVSVGEAEDETAAAVAAAAAALQRAYEDPDMTLQERFDRLLGQMQDEARLRAEVERSNLGLREQLAAAKTTLKDTRAVMVRMEDEIRRERTAADKARNDLKAAITAHEARLEEEEQRRTQLQLLLRKEQAINEVSKQSRLSEMHEMRRLEEEVAAVRGEKAELRQYLDNSIEENEALLRESRTLHAALGVSRQMVVAEETASTDQLAKLASLEQRMFGLYAKVAERDKQVEAWRQRCSVLEQDLDRAQVLLLARGSSHAPASFRHNSIQRGGSKAAIEASPAAALSKGPVRGKLARRDSWGQEESARRIIMQQQPQQHWGGAGTSLPPPGLKDSVRHYHSLSNNRTARETFQPKLLHRPPPPATDGLGGGGSRLSEMVEAMRRANESLPKGLQTGSHLRASDLYGHRELEPPRIR